MLEYLFAFVCGLVVVFFTPNLREPLIDLLPRDLQKSIPEVSPEVETIIMKGLGIMLIFLLSYTVGVVQILNLLFWASIPCAVVLGFAGRQVLSNLLSGLVIEFTKPFNIGDYVSVAEASGVVVSIGLFDTLMVTDCDEEVRVPNSTFSASLVKKHGRGALRTVLIPIRLSPKADLEVALQALDGTLTGIYEFIRKLNMTARHPGASTLAEHFKNIHGKELQDEQDEHPPKVILQGQGQDPASGHRVVLRVFCETSLVSASKQEAYRQAVKALRQASIDLA